MIHHRRLPSVFLLVVGLCSVAGLTYAQDNSSFSAPPILIPLTESDSTESNPGQTEALDQEIQSTSPQFSSSPASNLNPEDGSFPKGQFVKPPAPPKGGVIKVPHPFSRKGLIRIEEDGSYVYKTEKLVKTHSIAVKVGPMTPPSIQGPRAGISYSSLYGSRPVVGAVIDYEWQALKAFGSLGLQFGGGLITATGKGFLESGGRSLENYSLYMLPATAFVIYRFEYSNKQWFVPYFLAGGTVVGMLETRDDNKKRNTALAPAVGGAAGFHLSLTYLDMASAFALSSEFGVADLWLTVEGRVFQGLRSEVAYTTQMLTAGVTMDF